MEKGKRHFVLVHGACHGRWCWYKVVPLLKAAGHKVTTLDMAASGIHPKQVEELSSFREYVEPLMEFMESLEAEERVILVGHSLGGICISMAMESFPNKIAAAVFVSAFLPSPDLSVVALMLECNQRLDSTMDVKIVHDEGPDNHQASGHMLFGPDFLASHLYNRSPIEDLSLAVSLVRPSRLYGEKGVLVQEIEITKEKFGRVPTVYVVCDQDQVLKQDFQLSMVNRHPNYQHIQVIVAASDHMIMFSNPLLLSSSLQHIAATYS